MKRFVNWSGHSFLSLPVRFYLGWVFIIACLHKIAHPGSFALDIATYDVLPLSLVNIMAISLPWMELAVGIMIVLGFRTRAAALVVAGMMVMFIVAVALALAKGLDMSCGCFASQAAQDDDPISYLTVLRDTGWLLLALYVTFFDRNPFGLDRLLGRRRNPNV
ncbi:MAG: DoxX family membrane protein [Deltaproteobacteria bacterium]|nr:DoxX family membrane protein [Deltaproteobacteria bacterium]